MKHQIIYSALFLFALLFSSNSLLAQKLEYKDGRYYKNDMQIGRASCRERV